MALDSKLTQNINLRANGDQLLQPLEAFGREINKTIQGLNKLTDAMTAGGHKSEDSLRSQVQLLQRLIGEASTLQNILTSATNKRRDGLFAGLDDQTMGRKAASASLLARELNTTKTSADALEVRLSQLYSRFNDLATAGRKIGQNDLNKALNTEQALKQVRNLEREIQRLDNRSKATGGLSPDGTALRGQLQTAQDTLLSRIQNNRRVNWSGEITQVQLLVEKYRALTKAELDSATQAERLQAKARANILQNINLTEPELRAQINRGASRYSFTPDQARQFNMPQINAQIEQGTQRLGQFQLAMSKAMAQGRSQAVIDRLAQSFANLKERVTEATAQQKAYNNLPEIKGKNLLNSLFGVGEGGGLMSTIGRVGGFALAGAGIGAAISAVQGGVQYVVQLDDAFAKLQAISGSTDTEMAQFSKTIIDLGENTRYSTLEIAEGATQIAQAGYSAAQAGDVLKASLMLAAGSGSTVSEAVDTMTGALGAFQLQASDAGHIADVLMTGLNKSKLSINQMQAALQYAGATAHDTGMTLEELTATAGALAQAGIRSGSTIGTGIRQLLVDLQTPSEKFLKELKSAGLTMADVDVRANSLAGVVEKLSKAGFSAGAAYESFEVRAASAFLALKGQLDTYDQLSLALTQTGAAAEANAKSMESLGAKWTQTKNTLGDFVALLATPFVNALKVTLDMVNGLVGGINSLITGIAGASEGTSYWGGLLTGTLLPALAGFMVGGPMGAVIGGLLGFVGALSQGTTESDRLAAATDKAEQALTDSRNTITEVDDAINRLVERGAALKSNQIQLQVEVLNLTGKFEGLASQLDSTKLSYEGLMEAMVRYRGLKLQEEGEKARDVIISSQNEARPIVNNINENTGRLAEQANNFRQYGPEQYRNSAAIKRYQSYTGKSAGRDYGYMDAQSLLADQVELRGLINDLKALGQGNAYIDQIVRNLEQRLSKVQKLGELVGNIETSVRTTDIVGAINSPGGQARDAFLLSTRQQITEGLAKNQEKAGTGDVELRTVFNRAQAQLKVMRNQLAAAPAGSGQALALNQSINDLEAEITRVTRASDKATADMLKNGRAGKGEDMTGSEVASLIKSEFSGANVYSYQKRPYSEQVRLYNNYKAGNGPLAAKPGTSAHGTGHAIDMTPIPGMTIDQVAAFLEGRGLEITQALNERDPKTGRFHWHIAWSPKTSQYARRQSQEEAQSERELQKLLGDEASYKTGEAQKRIEAVIAEGKAGNKPVADMRAEFDQAALDYANASLNEFDVKNPTAGLSATALKARALARKALEEKLGTDVRKYFADFFRAVGDNMIDVMDRALKDSQRVLDAALQKADSVRRDAQRQIDIAGNRTNRHKVGAGTQYLLERDKERADNDASQTEIDARRAQIEADTAAVTTAEASANAMPDGEAKVAALAKIKEAWAGIKDEMSKVDQLQADLNAKTDALVQKPLKERLEGAAQAWLEQSGAMDSWSKKAEDAVGPTLDKLTDGMATFFTDIVTGTKSVKQALGDFLKSFATFVIQMIAKALALAAVKAILKAIGLDMPTGSGFFDGGQAEPSAGQASGAPGSYTGGPVIVGRYSGGVSHLPGGGKVTKGFSTHDSALYNLAAGEWVIRNKSVREIGAANMDMINKHGAAGLAKVAGAASRGFMNIQAPKQETNVYVVQEKRAPPLGKNDILVTIQEDILQGGVTKKLVKQVAQGA